MKEEYMLYGKCPYVTAQKLLSGKWTILIIYYLSHGVLRFGELQRKMEGITQATLTKQLRTLEEHGLISRKVYPEVPPKVEYSLTNIGIEFIPVLDQFKVWGEKCIAALNRDKVIK
ncbi:MAG: winged helix-turn-helix transcriptional regulator [Solirubrobacterales bacterium]